MIDEKTYQMTAAAKQVYDAAVAAAPALRAAKDHDFAELVRQCGGQYRARAEMQNAGNGRGEYSPAAKKALGSQRRYELNDQTICNIECVCAGMGGCFPGELYPEMVARTQA